MASGKPEESKLDRLKHFLGFSKSGTGHGPGIRPPSREFIFTAELLKEISSESPANNRMKMIRDLSKEVQEKELEPNAVETLWLTIADLLQPHVTTENRHIAMKFVICLIKGQYKNLGIMRAHFFRVIVNHAIPEDLAERLELFIVLSDNGKDLTYFEEETGPFLLKWMPELITFSKVAEFLQLLINAIKFNAAYLDQDVVSGLVRYTCVVANRSKSEENIDLCLQVLDTVVCYSFLPSDSLYYFIEALCRSVNVEKFCQTSWKLMRNLLGTHLGHSGIYTMCCILQDNRNLHDVSLLRGAVFFVGMALWGSKKVTSLKHTPSSVLPSFLQALQCKHALVAFEVVLSLERLVKKYGKELQLVAWDIILEILEYMLELTQTVIVHEAAVTSKLHDILSTIENLYEEQQYHGSTSTFFNIIEKCATKRPEHSVLLLIMFRAQSIHPAKEDWIRNIYVLMEKYFRQDTRTKIRLKALDVLADIISKNKQLYEDDLVKEAVLPHLGHIESDSDPEVRVLATQLLVNLALGCSSPRCMEILALIEKVVQRPRQKTISSSSLAKESEGLCMREDCCPEDIKTAVFGLVDIFKTKMFSLPSSHAVKAYELLISHLQDHYSQNFNTESSTAIRLMIFQCFLSLRADALHRLGLIEPFTQNKRKYSYFMQCDYRDVSERRNSRVSPASSAAPSPVIAPFNSTVLQYTQAFSMFNCCLEFEKDWRVLRVVLEGLCLLLQNKTLVLAASDYVESMSRKLCAMVSDRNLGLPEKLRETPQKFSKSEFHSYIFPVLASLVTYHCVLDKQRQWDLIHCLEFGLVSPKCAKICVSALILCTMEMQEVMMREMPSVLVKFSQISATVAMAAPMLEFLSNLINIPKLYSNFVEDHYRSVFAIALPYTNPFKFSHYAVSLAYRVIVKWFLKCRLTFRKDMVSFINRGLHANVLRQLRDSTVQKMQSVAEEPSFRQRSNTIGTAMRKRRSKGEEEKLKEVKSREAPASFTDSKPGVDESLSAFHQELIETCIDVLARYTFATVTSMPKRTSVTEFLLAGGQSQSWLLGNRIITITTSGGGNKLGKSGLCDKCTALCKTGMGNKNDTHEDPFSLSASEEKLKTDGASSMRRRHKSAYVSPRPREALRQQSVDDIQLHKHGSSPEERETGGAAVGGKEERLESDTNIGKSLGTEGTQTMDSLVQGLKHKSSVSPHVCSCWCQGWAEVYIRRPSGNISWIMRLENESLLFTSSGQDFPLADIGTLFMYNAEKAFDADSIGRIDSESLGENEYESLYEQHFPSFDEKPPITTDGSVADSAQPELVLDVQDMSGVTLEIAGLRETEITKQDSRDTTSVTKREEAGTSAEVISPDVSWGSSDKDGPVSGGGPVKRVTVRRTSSSPNLGSFPTQATPEFLNTGQLQAQQTLSPPSDPVKMHSESNISEILHSEDKHGKPPAPAFSAAEHGVHTLHSALNTQVSVDSTTLSSFNDEIHALPVISRRPRGHTLSVMDNLESGRDSGRGIGREAVKNGINPSFVFLQLYHSAFFGASKEEKPLVLPQNEVIERAMKNLDRIAPQETHKLAVLYVGPGQVGDEGSILRNVYGSSRYAEFLRGLGSLLRLSDCNPDHVYVGGLDLNGNDGHFAYSWHGDQMQVIFHVATLMPNKESDPNCNAKKLHIGNDYVTIVYNESGEDYQTGTIKCQFNFVNIVIQPLDHESNAVTVRAKEDIAPIIGHQDTKIISDNHLSVFVRQMALHANLASLILMRQNTNPSDPYASNWLERLRQIKRIKSKILQLQSTSNQNKRADSVNEDFTEFV
ncbi:tuberin [Lingula anatina]|uniref:Tuberin n=1 Tax=Lingula anatina TaxID=7574 RepID=A0A1S3HHV4_LINAN|nr:tuberin [Lingula anatina]|eukprot:XP_013385066.2 tuberin [Lingula anatina]